MTEFKLTEKQVKKLKTWKDSIKEQHGQYGLYDYIFTPYDYGTGLKVVSHITKNSIDLSDVETW